MAFNAAGLTALAATDIFTFWYYTTGDTRAQVLAAGYFTRAGTWLAAGHLILCQTSDAMSFLPVRSGNTVGAGLVIDTGPAPLRLNGAAEPRYVFSMSSVMPALS